MTTKRDEIVAEYHGKDSNYFSLAEWERTRSRMLAVERCLGKGPEWLTHWENSLVDLPQEERNEARPFACGLIASHMTEIWASANAHEKTNAESTTKEKRRRNQASSEICEDCQSELQVIRICPHCEGEHPNKKPAVFLP